jgi:ABC-type Fe3+ transport system substrate-binding protein
MTLPNSRSDREYLKFVESGTDVAVRTIAAGGALVPAAYDYIGLTYTGSNPTTIVYKTGGALGTTVATLTLTYDGSNNVLTVTKT